MGVDGSVLTVCAAGGSVGGDVGAEPGRTVQSAGPGRAGVSLRSGMDLQTEGPEPMCAEDFGGLTVAADSGFQTGGVEASARHW